MTAARDSYPVYESTVTAVGPLVEDFLAEGVLVFFGPRSPVELHEISVLHDATTANDGPRPGDVLELGSEVAIEVLAVGAVVRDNLLNLGHLDLKADGRREPSLPGDVCVRRGVLPMPAAGDRFRILRAHRHDS